MAWNWSLEVCFINFLRKFIENIKWKLSSASLEYSEIWMPISALHELTNPRNIELPPTYLPLALHICKRLKSGGSNQFARNCKNFGQDSKVTDNYTSIYSTPSSLRFSTMLLFDESELTTPPEPTGDWSISQGDFIKIFCLLCSSLELLTTGSFSSSKNQTW